MLTFISSRFRSLVVLFPLFISAYSYALTIEENASGFCSFDGATQSTYSGAVNNLYVNLSNDAGKGITWSVQAAQAGNYSVQFRYANAGSQSATQAALRVNGVVIAHALPFPKTATWSSWTNSTAFTVALNSGNNTIRLETTVATEFANIDSLTINGAGLAAGTCSGAGAPKSPNGGVIAQPQASVLASTPTPGSGIDLTREVPGEFDVTSSGQASYTIPVLTAPGSAGLVPKVSVGYSSGAGNGLMGLGWSLNAGGAISRCRQTEGQDKNALPITWSSQDRFCLNGERLLAVSGSYGAPGSVYKTEIDNYARITASGGTAGHPDYFTVEYKDGLIETYGNTSQSINSQEQLSSANSNTVLNWHLSRQTDSAGNKVEYHYTRDADGLRIVSIGYAYGATQTPGAHIYFDYADRVDPISGYVAGHYYKLGKRISAIRSVNLSDGQYKEIRRYKFTYNQNTAYTLNDKLSRINKVEECVEIFCPSFVDFDWQSFEQQIDAQGYSSSFIGGVSDYRLGDINGDGLMDLVWYEEAKKLPNTLHDFLQKRSYRYSLGEINTEGRYIFNTANSYRSPSIYDDRSLHIVDSNNDGIGNIIAGGLKDVTDIYLDVNGDGLVDRIKWTDGARPWEFYHYPLQTISYASPNPNADTTSSEFYRYVGGGMRQKFDTTNHVPSINDASRWEDFSYFQPSSGGQPAVDNLHLAPIRFIWPFVGDFNGSGRMDLVAETYSQASGCVDDGNEEGCPSIFSRPSIYTMQKPTSTEPQWVNGVELKYFNASIAYMANRAFAVDLNGDGLTDMLVGGGTNWYFRLSNGLGLGPEQYINVPGGPFATTDQIATDVAVADYNGDGYPDIIWHSPNAPFNNTGASSGQGSIKVKYWDPSINNFEVGERFIKSEPYQVLTNYGDARYGWNFSFNRFKTTAISMMDLDGDGRLELIVTPTRQTGAVTVYKGIGSQSPINKVIGIRDNHGKNINISYEAINRTGHYIGGHKVYNANDAEMCTTIANSSGYYTRSMCWSVDAAATQSDFYRNINDPWRNLSSDEQSLKPDSPVSSSVNAAFVVTNTAQSSPLSNNSSALKQTAYFYEQARAQAAGRGFLGFEAFTSVDRETGVRVRNTFRQDWPYVGRLNKSQTFTEHGNKQSETVNQWALVNCYVNGVANNQCVESYRQTIKSQGSAVLGSLAIFLRKEDAKEYALLDEGYSQGALLKNSVTTNTFDNKGNVLESKIITSSNLGLPTLTKTTTNIYTYSGSSWSMQQGRLQRMTVAANEPTYGTITRKSSFTYYQSGADIGLLNTETVEPDNPEFTVTTTHTYSIGNRISSSTTADGQTRKTEVEYDSLGRYVDKTYEFFTNGVDVNTPIKYLATQVTTRDKYGTPTLSRRYYSSSAFITHKTATTTFGTPYFNAASTGEFTETQMGLGADAYGVCPSDTKTWSLARMAGGAVAIQCEDLLGRVRRAGNLGFNGNNWSLVDTEYDKLGRVIRSSTPYASDTSSRYWTSYSYDILGRVTETRTPYKNTSVVTTTRYENLNVVIINPKNQIRVEKRNLAGQVIEVVDPNNGTTTFAYDARGNMREMKDPAQNTTTIGYDLRDRKTSMSDPDKGNWSYQYSRFNELTCQRDGKNQIITMVYDIRGRMVNRIERLNGSSCNSTTVSYGTYWVYDKASNGLGQLESVYTAPIETSEFRQRFKYDNRGRLSTKETSVYGYLGARTTHNEKMTYDQYNRVYQQFDAARAVNTFETNGVQHIYNAQGYLQKVVDAISYNGSQQAYYTIQNQDARGNVISAVYGNGVTQSAAYEPETGLTQTLRATRAYPTQFLQDIELEWDEVGNLSSRHERGTAGELTPRNIRETFGYDSLNRLQYWSSLGDLTASESVTYDAIDNIRSKNNRPYYYGNDCGSGLNAGPHAVCNVNDYHYRYDNNGNLTDDGRGRSLQYTRDDLAAQIMFGSYKTQFAYDPNRSRYKRVDTSAGQQTTTLYIGSVEKVYYPDGSVEWKRNIAGVGQITQTMNNQGVITGEAQRYFIKDHLGSISLVTDEIGGVEQSFYFDPWGMSRKVITASGIKKWDEDQARYRLSNKPITTRGFTGHEHLAEVDFIHMNGRIYDARIGRFIQADPIIQDPLRVQSLNRYSYVWNNPLNATDPSGFQCDKLRSGNGCTAEAREKDSKKVEEVKVEGIKPSAQKNTGLTYTITNPTAVQQWLKDNNLSMDNFSTMMKDQGISKASGSNRARAGSGAFLADGKGNVVGFELEEKNGTATYALGEVSAAAEEAVGGAQRKDLTGAYSPISGDYYTENGELVSVNLQIYGNGNETLVGVDGLTAYNFDYKTGLLVNPLATGAASPVCVLECLIPAAQATRFAILGKEISFGKNFRIAPFGNRTGNQLGRWPHYHRRGIDSLTGNTKPGHGIGRHRPWETKSTDKSNLDRF